MSDKRNIAQKIMSGFSNIKRHMTDKDYDIYEETGNKRPDSARTTLNKGLKAVGILEGQSSKQKGQSAQVDSYVRPEDRKPMEVADMTVMTKAAADADQDRPGGQNYNRALQEKKNRLAALRKSRTITEDK